MRSRGPLHIADCDWIAPITHGPDLPAVRNVHRSAQTLLLRFQWWIYGCRGTPNVGNGLHYADVPDLGSVLLEIPSISPLKTSFSPKTTGYYTVGYGAVRWVEIYCVPSKLGCPRFQHPLVNRGDFNGVS